MRRLVSIIDSNHATMSPFLERLVSKPETSALCILGSHARTGSRPQADIWSDFDLALFLDLPVTEEQLRLAPLAFQEAIQPLLPDWLPNFKFVVPEAGCAVNQILRLQVNVHQLVLTYEESSAYPWPEDRREAFQTTCEIYYDPLNRIPNLLRSKLSTRSEAQLLRVTRNLAIVPVLVEHSVLKCAARSLFLDAHLALMDAADHTIELFYDINSRPLPHRKWRFAHLHSLDLRPAEGIERLAAILSPEPLSVESLTRKAKLLLQVCAELQGIAIQQGLVQTDPYQEFVTKHAPGWQLRAQTAADREFGPAADQYTKMADERWNGANFRAHSAEGERHREYLPPPSAADRSFGCL